MVQWLLKIKLCAHETNYPFWGLSEKKKKRLIQMPSGALQIGTLGCDLWSVNTLDVENLAVNLWLTQALLQAENGTSVKFSNPFQLSIKVITTK